MTIFHTSRASARHASSAAYLPPAPRQSRWPQLARLAGAALLCFSSSACGTPAPPASPPAAGAAGPTTSAASATSATVTATAVENQAELWRQIQAEVGDAACDAPQQCHSSAVGSKACGGPSAHLAWSTRRSDANRLSALLTRHAAASQAAQRDSEMMSTCEVVSDPGATCRAGRCVLLPRGLGGSEAR